MTRANVSSASSGHKTQHCDPGKASTAPVAGVNCMTPVYSELQTAEFDSICYTPVEQLLPNTGGAYVDWEFHPSRLHALLQLERNRQIQEDSICNAVPSTPPGQIIPNTGGAYENWKYHPCRRQAMLQLYRQQSDEGSDAVPFTQPEQIIPGTGGAYKDWEFHPARLHALLQLLLQSQKNEIVSDAMNEAR